MPVTNFQEVWRKEFPWAKEGVGKLTVMCTWCNSSFVFDSMGRSALVSHSKSKRHTTAASSKAKSYPINYLFGCKKNTEPIVPGTSIQPSIATPQNPEETIPCLPKTPTSSTSTLEKLVLKDNVTQAEIIWCLHTVYSHMSLRTAENGIKLMKLMFPDCTTALDLKLHKDKVAYSIVYGLGYYFENEIRNKVKSCKHFVVAFDESLNRVAQKTQMDFNVRFWDEETNKVRTRYLTSQFLNHAKATDLLDGFKKGLSGFDLSSILQISMDGPNVNFSFLRMFKEEMKADMFPDTPEVLELGSCGLHTVHGAFKSGITVTGWRLVPFFRATHNLFKLVPARRGDFVSVTKSNLFPHKFCNIRWLENTQVANRCLEILPALQMYVESVKRSKTEPDCESFKVVSSMLTDKLLPAKVAFFKGVSEGFEPFLREFQSDKPLVPFLHGALFNLLRNLMSRFVKREVLEKAKLTKVDLEKKEDGLFVNLLPAKEIDLGYGTRSALRKCTGVTSKETLSFRKDVRSCLLAIVLKLINKSPLKYPLTESLTALNPTFIASSKDEACNKLKSVLDTFIDKNIIGPNVAEKADREFQELVSQSSVARRMEAFRRSETPLDDFWMEILASSHNVETNNFAQIVKICLILSHGNASVERGFSVNKDILVENLKEESLVAQRILHDAIAEKGGVENMLPLPKSVILSMRNAHSRYKEDDENRKRKIAEKDRVAVEKRKALQKAMELEAKKMKLMAEKSEEIASLDEEIKKLRKGI